MIPPWAWTWFLTLFFLLLTFGALLLAIHLGWYVNMQVELFSTREQVERQRLQNQVEHEKKLLGLEFEKAKVMNDQIIEASKS